MPSRGGFTARAVLVWLACVDAFGFGTRPSTSSGALGSSCSSFFGSGQSISPSSLQALPQHSAAHHHRLGPPPKASHLTTMSRRSRRRKRGAAIGEKRNELDVARQQAYVAGQPSGALDTPAVRQPFPYVCVVDVEATCEEHSKHYIHEIIEFPVVVFDTSKGGGIVAEFHTFVRPTINSTLTPFCTKLTGITQEQVDAAPTLAETLQQFDAWLDEKGFVHSDERKDFAFACDGPWDLRFFLHGECARKGVEKPAYFDKWCNIKALFADYYNVRPCKIGKMLSYQGMKFEGRLHSGIDDTRNIARIAMRMRDDGAVLYNNEALPPAMRAGGVLADRATPSNFKDALKVM